MGILHTGKRNVFSFLFFQMGVWLLGGMLRENIFKSNTLSIISLKTKESYHTRETGVIGHIYEVLELPLSYM